MNHGSIPKLHLQYYQMIMEKLLPLLCTNGRGKTGKQFKPTLLNHSSISSLLLSSAF